MLNKTTYHEKTQLIFSLISKLLYYCYRLNNIKPLNIL